MGKMVDIIYIVRVLKLNRSAVVKNQPFVSGNPVVISCENSLPELEYRQGALVQAGPVIVVIPGRLKTKVR